ncbi:MAG: lactate utilization protein [Candidatus Competibacter denitrificans]
MSEARANILNCLRNSARPQPAVAEPEAAPAPPLSQADRVAQLKQRMEAMHAEVIITNSGDWTTALKAVLRQRSLNGLLYAPHSPIGVMLSENWDSDLPPLVGYEQSVEDCKERLFSIDAGITSTQGGLADVGALILWPTPDEPRLMSLAPAVHIAVLEASKIHDSLAAAMRTERWAEGMPTNALLISGPSKTADIELVLTFGVHGPKELVVLILNS